MTMTLLNSKENAHLCFLAYGDVSDEERKKLVDLGLVPGEKIKILGGTRFGFITVMLKGGKIALDTNSASKILVKEI